MLNHLIGQVFFYPKKIYEDCATLYAFCRILDDITDEKTKKDIFLHVSALEKSKLRILKEVQIIAYDIKEEKDKLQAINIKKK